MDATLADVLNLIDSGGTLALLLLIVVGGMRGWYVWRREFDLLVEDRDFWREIGRAATTTAERSIDLHEQRRTGGGP